MSSEGGIHLIGLKLDGYTVNGMQIFEVRREGGTEVGLFFKDSNLALDWVLGQADAVVLKTHEVLIITNGERYFLFQGTEIKFNDH